MLVVVPQYVWTVGQVPFSKVLYIESSDFRLEDSKDYYGLAPGKSVLLRSVISICVSCLYCYLVLSSYF